MGLGENCRETVVIEDSYKSENGGVGAGTDSD